VVGEGVGEGVGRGGGIGDGVGVGAGDPKPEAGVADGDMGRLEVGVGNGDGVGTGAIRQVGIAVGGTTGLAWGGVPGGIWYFELVQPEDSTAVSLAGDGHWCGEVNKSATPRAVPVAGSKNRAIPALRGLLNGTRASTAGRPTRS